MAPILKSLAQPYTAACLLTLLALAYAWYRRREARRALGLALLPFLAVFAMSLPLVAGAILAPLERAHPPLGEWPGDREVVVVLAGGIRPPNAARGAADPDEDSALRGLHGLALYRRKKACRLVLSGGAGDPDRTEWTCARVLGDFLVQAGAAEADLLLEGRSRNTHENALYCRELLRAHGVDRVVLVTDAAHMPRAVGCFRKQGFDVVAAPCNFRRWAHSSPLGPFVPEPRSAHASRLGLYEWAGLAWYWWLGRI
jgi:uncharacterized SAM-binding protein YcdF (DUF218 family)